ncbi:MAG: peptidase, partial [Bacteroidales bacterium]
MNWNKWNRWIHRDLGYLFFGMSLVYGVSGIALNHGVARHWDPGIVTRSEELVFPGELNREEFNREMLEQILDLTGEKKNYKN